MPSTGEHREADTCEGGRHGDIPTGPAPQELTIPGGESTQRVLDKVLPASDGGGETASSWVGVF